MQGLVPLKNVEQFYCQTVVFFNRVKPLEIQCSTSKGSLQMLDRWRAVLIPSLVGQHDVDVVRKGAPALRDAAGQR